MPKRDVLQTGDEVPAQHPGKTYEAFGGDRVALVRHGRRALLADCEGLFDLADLGPLEIADLGRESLDGGAERGARVQVLAMAVPGDHLGGRNRRQAESAAHVLLDRRVDVGIGADGSRKLANSDRLSCAAQPRPVAVSLQAGQGELGAEGGRLGVHAVRPADGGHRRELVGPALRDRHQAVDRVEKDVGGPDERR